MALGRWGIHTAAGGVVRFTDSELDRAIYLRVKRESDQRWVVSELYIPPMDRSLTTDDLRRIPLGQIEARCNAPELSERLSTVDPKQLSLEQVYAIDAEFGDTVLQFYREERRARLLLPVPAGRDYGDAFYGRVAAAYRTLVSEGRPPGPALAEANDVPVTTARRWFKEARRRGFLPPGRTGKVG